MTGQVMEKDTGKQHLMGYHQTANSHLSVFEKILISEPRVPLISIHKTHGPDIKTILKSGALDNPCRQIQMENQIKTDTWNSE